MEIDTYEYEAGQNRGERKEEKAEEEERIGTYILQCGWRIT